MRGTRHWHGGTLVCAWSGHVAPAAQAAVLGPDDAGLGVDLPEGGRIARCLRCDLWLRVPVPTPAEARWPTVPPLDQLELPLRGRALHDRLVLRLIAVERAVHVVLFATVAVVALIVELHLSALQGWADESLAELRTAVDQTSRGASHDWLVEQLQRLADLQADDLWMVAVAAGLLALLEAAEVVGLWRGRRWAEYLTVVATCLLLPLEVRDVLDRPTPIHLTTLAVNLAVVAWLVWAKRLFGLRGGAAAAEHPIDWPAVVAAGTTPATEPRIDDGAPALPEPRLRRR